MIAVLMLAVAEYIGRAQVYLDPEPEWEGEPH